MNNINTIARSGLVCYKEGGFGSGLRRNRRHELTGLVLAEKRSVWAFFCIRDTMYSEYDNSSLSYFWAFLFILFLIQLFR